MILEGEVVSGAASGGVVMAKMARGEGDHSAAAAEEEGVAHHFVEVEEEERAAREDVTCSTSQ